METDVAEPSAIINENRDERQFREPQRRKRGQEAVSPDQEPPAKQIMGGGNGGGEFHSVSRANVSTTAISNNHDTTAGRSIILTHPLVEYFLFSKQFNELKKKQFQCCIFDFCVEVLDVKILSLQISDSYFTMAATCSPTYRKMYPDLPNSPQSETKTVSNNAGPRIVNDSDSSDEDPTFDPESHETDSDNSGDDTKDSIDISPEEEALLIADSQ